MNRACVQPASDGRRGRVLVRDPDRARGPRAGRRDRDRPGFRGVDRARRRPLDRDAPRVRRRAQGPLGAGGGVGCRAGDLHPAEPRPAPRHSPRLRRIAADGVVAAAAAERAGVARPGRGAAPAFRPAQSKLRPVSRKLLRRERRQSRAAARDAGGDGDAAATYWDPGPARLSARPTRRNPVRPASRVRTRLERRLWAARRPRRRLSGGARDAAAGGGAAAQPPMRQRLPPAPLPPRRPRRRSVRRVASSPWFPRCRRYWCRWVSGPGPQSSRRRLYRSLENKESRLNLRGRLNARQAFGAVANTRSPQGNLPWASRA